MRSKLVLLTWVILCIYFPSMKAQNVTFTDVTDIYAIEHTHGIGGMAGAGGVSMIDFNNDGLDDLTLTATNEYPVLLFESTSIGGMSPSYIFDYGYGLTEQLKNMLWVDYDNDGDKDLFTSCFKGGGSRLYNNEGGLLLNVTTVSGLNILYDYPLTTHTSAWGDVDNDGYLDLFIGNRPNSGGQPWETNLLFKNLGDGTFQDVSDQMNVAEAMTCNTVGFTDVNNDGWTDLFIAVDKMDEPNVLYINQQGNGFFKVVSDGNNPSDVDGLMDAMSVENGDYDNDGDLDIYVTNNFNGNYLFRNDGGNIFTNVADELGIAVNKFNWGANFFDYDNDGWLDLFTVVQQYVNADSIIAFNRNPLYKNNNGTFEEVFIGTHEDTLSLSYGSAVGDINDDGYYDIAVVNSDSTYSKLYLNSGGTNNWVKINLEGVASNRDGIGTWIKVYSNGYRQVRYTTCGNSYNSQNSDNIIIGIGQASTIDSIQLFWPSGLEETYYNVVPNNKYDYKEGDAPIITVSSSNTSVHFTNLYPNPIKNGKIRFQTKNAISHFNIYNSLGQRFDLMNVGNLEYGIEFSVDSLPKGIYYLNCKMASGEDLTLRFIKAG